MGWTPGLSSPRIEAALLVVPKVNEIEKVIAILAGVPEGKALVFKALSTWQAKDLDRLTEHFEWSDLSRTDMVLTRHFNPKTGKEERERQVKVYLRERQSPLEVALDMAHELVHATAQPGFDPYDSKLTPGKYILSAIEGDGGEVDAVFSECQVGRELAEKYKFVFSRCDGYYPKSSQGPRQKQRLIVRNRIRQHFYRVGRWWPELTARLHNELNLFPDLTSDHPNLFSSTGHAPYPAALLKEFDEITEMACKNTKKRVMSVESVSVGSGYLPLDWHRDSTAHSDTQEFMKKRCIK